MARDEIERYSFKQISIITWMEILAGCDETSSSPVRSFLTQFECIALSPSVAEKAVIYSKTYRINLPDAIIMATADVENALLITRNTKDFGETKPFICIPYRL